MAQRIRENSAKAAHEVDNRPVGATVSIGLVHCDDPVLNIAELLMQAKERGRNRIEVASLEMLIESHRRAGAIAAKPSARTVA